MAGDWIKIETCTVDKPEIVKMSDRLGIDQDAAFGKCVRVWIWADGQSRDGRALSVTKTFIDRITFCDGFADAMISVGWLIENDGKFDIPSFGQHNGKSAKTRAKNTKRQKEHRSRNGDVTQRARQKNDIGNAESETKARPEKRREEKEKDKKENRIVGDFEEMLLDVMPSASGQMKKSWNEWVDHCRVIRQRVTVLSAEKLLAEIVSWGEKRSIAAINYSIANGYKGLFEPRSQSHQHTGPTSQESENYLKKQREQMLVEMEN